VFPTEFSLTPGKRGRTLTAESPAGFPEWDRGVGIWAGFPIPALDISISVGSVGGRAVQSEITEEPGLGATALGETLLPFLWL